MERKIGEIFEYNGEWYQCVKSVSCGECAFLNSICIDNSSIKCSADYRNDNCSVVFKKLEKVGEPYDDCGTILQRFRIHTNVTNADTKGLELNIYSNNTIGIEIKQNKEDMEEKKVRLKKEDIDFLYNKFIEITEDCVVKGYNIDNVQHEFGKLFLIKDSDTKLNLKPFDLEAAKSGKPVCTRDGRKARIICFNRESIGFPIIALVKNGDTEGVYQFDDKGRSNIDDEERGYDLMMLPEKKEGWVNVYKERIYSTKEEAIQVIYDGATYIDTIKFSWEE